MSTYRTYFKDKRTGTVYVCPEKTWPTTGKIPLNPAYKEDRVWIDHQYLERVDDPHKMTSGNAWWTFLIVLAWIMLMVFDARSLVHQGTHLEDAVILTFVAAVFGCTWTLKFVGITHT